MKKLHYIFVFLILSACLVPSVLLVCGFNNPNRENRPLAKFPKLVSDGGLNGDFFTQFDSWVDDRFGLRDVLVNAFNTADVAVLRDFNGTNAVIGKGNSVFYGETVKDYLGINALSERELDAIANYLADIQKKANDAGAGFVFMTAPNKATIYPELMPGWLRPTGAVRNIDALTAVLHEKGVCVLDAKSILLDAKEVRSVYYEQDSHWNNYGAMCVYNGLARLLSLEKHDPNEYTTVFDRTGDLHYFVYPTSEYHEERIVYPEFNPWSSRRPIDFERDKEVSTTCDVNGVTVVMYHDSFGRSLQPILSQGVGSLYMNSYFPYDTGFIERYSPDFVVIELVERNLPKLAEIALSLGY